MRIYITLDYNIYDLDRLNTQHRDIVDDFIKYFNEDHTWYDFSNHWIKVIQPIINIGDRKENIKLPIFKIGQDLEARLGIKQGYVKKPNNCDFDFHKTYKEKE